MTKTQRKLNEHLKQLLGNKAIDCYYGSLEAKVPSSLDKNVTWHAPTSRHNADLAYLDNNSQ